MRLAWCDKIAIVWGGFLFLILATAWKGNYFWWGEPHWTQFGGARIWDSEPPIWIGAWQFGWWLVGIPWLVLRLIDLSAGGPWRRRGFISVRPVVRPGSR